MLKLQGSLLEIEISIKRIYKREMILKNQKLH